MNYWQYLKIGVFGSAGGSDLDLLQSKAGIIGLEIAKRGYIMVTGGCPGLPLDAAKGANENGGLVLGISPAMNLDEHINLYKFPVDPYLLIFTGLNKKGRNIINTRTCNGAIFISGRSGTLNEFTTFYDEATEKNVVGLLSGSGGVVDRHIIPYIQETEKNSKAKVVIERDPARLVSLMHVSLMNINL